MHRGEDIIKFSERGLMKIAQLLDEEHDQLYIRIKDQRYKIPVRNSFSASSWYFEFPAVFYGSHAHFPNSAVPVILCPAWSFKGGKLKYYVYFDAYGHARRFISEKELARKFNNQPQQFLSAMCLGDPDAAGGPTTGHVGILRFETETELQEYLEGLGDEIAGFYGCWSESRPYNF